MWEVGGRGYGVLDGLVNFFGKNVQIKVTNVKKGKNNHEVSFIHLANIMCYYPTSRTKRVQKSNDIRSPLSPPARV